jgi:hypothetical protein
VGDKAGSRMTTGYLRCTLDKRNYRVHQLAWLYVYGVWPQHQIDHINHDKADNRIANLRDVTCSMNNQNRRRQSRNASGFLGVSWSKDMRRWIAGIKVAGKTVNLGYFADKNDAIKARLTAERKYHPSRPVTVAEANLLT